MNRPADTHVEHTPLSTTTQKLAAEAIGTFVLVFLGCGSLILASTGSGFGDANILSVGLSFGFAVAVMIYALGRISGGHFNPAVSIGAAISGRMAWHEVPKYAGAQIGGAILGALTLLVMAQGNASYDAFSDSLAANGWGDEGTGYPLWAALLLEIVLTALFVFVVLAVTDKRSEHPALAPLVIGVTLAVLHFVAIPLTGTSVNPARSIGPALFSGPEPLIQLWVFLLAPTLGALAAGLLYPAVFGRDGDVVAGSGLILPKKPVRKAKASTPAADQGGRASAGQTGTAQPIIQDGWQWDPAAQQWIPAQQPPASEPASDRTQARPNLD